MKNIEVILRPHRGRGRAGGILIRDGTSITLSRRQAQVAWVLAKRPGAVVPMDRIIGHCWPPDEEPENPACEVRKHIMRLRRRLQRLGLAIFGGRQLKRGYQLVEAA